MKLIYWGEIYGWKRKVEIPFKTNTAIRIVVLMFLNRISTCINTSGGKNQRWQRKAYRENTKYIVAYRPRVTQ
jgi:hypothetical protein